MLYYVLRGAARIALRWYYRRIEVIGLERIPAEGPAILAANHSNALVDALIVGCMSPRMVRLTAKATLLDHPVTRVIVGALGVIPLRRARDERATTPTGTPDESRNAGAFAAVHDTLAAGGLVLIFPEGISHSEPALAPLRTGAARMLLQARIERGLDNLPIIPVGLTFEEKWRPRSRVLMHVGDPITTHGLDPSDPDAVPALTARLDAGLRAVTLNFATHDDAERVLEVSALLTGVLDRVRSLDAPDPPLADAVELTRRLEGARRHLPGVSGDIARAVDVFLERLEAFRRRVHAVGVAVNDIWMPTSISAGGWFAAREAAITILAAPIAFWGRVNHWTPLVLARRVGRATARTPDEPAMHTLVSGFVFVLAFYALVSIAVGLSAGWWWSTVYLLSLPPSASVDFWLTDRVRNAVRRARGYIEFRGTPTRQQQLIDEAAWLRSEARRLETLLR
jgi:glycerol-3-phosphate O-acyltransferase / dihydroxyacetone phosphate acyltransferase